jgi:hypothetical protein
MKINQAAVNPQANTASREVAEKAYAAADENKTNQSPALENVNDGVTLTMSQRNSVPKSNNDFEPIGGILHLLESLNSNPEDTAGLHANLSPERVLHLLA